MQFLGSGQNDIGDLGQKIYPDGLTVAKLQQRSPVLDRDVTQHHGITLIGIIGVHDLLAELLVAQLHRETLCHHIFVTSALKLIAQLLIGSVSVNQKQLSGREQMPVQTVCHIDVGNDDQHLHSEHNEKHFGDKQLPCHQRQLQIQHHICHNGRQHLGEHDLSILLVPQPHSSIGC